MEKASAKLMYERETRIILKRFKEGRLNLPAAIAALDAALAKAISNMTKPEMDDLRATVLANNDEVVGELGRRRQG